MCRFVRAVGRRFFLAWLFLLTFSLLIRAQTGVQFLQAYGFNPSGTMYAMIAADFNSDGKLDIAWAGEPNTSGLQFTGVQLGNGDGTFKAGATPSVSGGAIAAADFNGDGKTDLLVANQLSGTIFSVLLGNGDGTFQAAINTNPGAAFTSVIAADINGDGKPDVLGEAGGTLFALLGNGDGTFQPAVMTTLATSSLLVGDFNGDGKLDVATFVSTQGSYSLEVLLGNGDGTFKPPVVNSSVIAQPGNGAVADVNGDGKPDVVGYDNSTGEVLTFLGNGDGTFGTPITAATVFPYVWVIAVADLNGDGKPDLVEVSDFVEIFQGNGDGTFTHTNDYALNFGAVANNGGGPTPAEGKPVSTKLRAGAHVPLARTSPERYFVGASSTGIAASIGSAILIDDFNNDGKLDIAVAGETGSLFLGRGDGTFQAALAVPPGTPFSIAAIGDFNNDGKTDAAIGGGNGIEIFLGDGTGALKLAQNYTASVGSQTLATADLNLDSKLDLVFVNYGSSETSWTLSAMLGKGDGSFATPISSSGGSISAGSSIYGPKIGDFNGDKIPDVAVVDSNGLEVCLGKGDGTFASPITTFAGTTPSAFAISDFNNDGKLDAAVYSSAGIGILLGKGDGTFQPPMFLSEAHFETSLLAADVNGDGKIDLMFTIHDSQDTRTFLQVWLGNGDGTFKAVQEQTIGAFQGYAAGVWAASDFNGDGKVDVLVTTQFELAIALGKGDGTFSAADAIELGQACCPPGAGPFSFTGVGDFNGDKKPDLLVTVNEPKSFPAHGGAFVLLNTTPGAVSIRLAIASGSSGSATVQAGHTASYNLTIAGINGTASLSCTGAPTGATCSVPASINVSASSSTPFAVTVATTARSSVMLRPNRNGFQSWPFVLGLFAIACFPVVCGNMRPMLRLRSGLLMVMVLFLSSCGGGGSDGSHNSGGTPAGSYHVTVTATSGSTTGSTNLTLVVQ